ncbi:CDP-glycerol glycerophosphotransferase family protein [Weissella minor]|uniref:CDP-glycerol glycerophosphotransferase family protein n=1 Tax=Weissella minor TaxID=1620 RepID=UPI001BAFFE12|nr:CDP-glycerol glycerophosphotransferase family protein [Weissella minor]MBS0949453.1 CDP-glycerol glycerophosphotransferase family protein [Weissella minor]
MKEKVKNVTKRAIWHVEDKLTADYTYLKQARKFYINNYEKIQVEQNVILYESRDGQSMTDSPLALFLYLKQRPEYKNFKHVWVTKDLTPENIERLQVNVPKAFRENIIWVQRDSIEYAKWLLKAKYLITNSTFQSFVNKKPEQIYINTWHGTPLKHMGYDIPGSKASLKNVQRNFLMSDYILSPNAHTSNIFLDRYMLNGLYEGEVVEAGYPRMDMMHDVNRGQLINELVAKGLQIDQQQDIVLYTPTWKGTSIKNPTGNMTQLVTELGILQADNPEKTILVKVHPYAYKLAQTEPKLQPYLIPDEFDTNRLLGITDILITDYSSIFFDYLVTGKPIIFYAWDQELYQGYRGMYFEDNELPGPVVQDIHEVGQLLQNPEQMLKDYHAQYSKMQDTITPYDDGGVTDRIIDYVFDASAQAQMVLHKPSTVNTKKKLLIYPGGMADNGITSSAINLSRQLDYDRYDVTFLLWDSNKAAVLNNIDKLDPRVRFIYRFGVNALTGSERRQDQYVNKNGITGPADSHMPISGYRRETQRLFNSIEFDVLIDFSGYSYNGLKLFTVMPRQKLLVYQHNDLMSDSQKVINGKQPHAKKLTALFTLYQLVDGIVSVSEALKEINQRKLKDYIRAEQMLAVPNLLPSENKLEVSDAVASSPYGNINDLQSKAVFRFEQFTEYAKLADIPMNQGHKQSAVADIRVVGEAWVNERRYFKLVIDNLPRGWVMAREVELKMQNELLSSEPLEQVAWVYKNRRRLFKSPFLAEGTDVVTNGQWITHTFVQIVARADTTDGRYYQLILPDRDERVWFKEPALLLMQPGRLNATQRAWNKLVNRHTERSYSAETSQLVQLPSNLTVTSRPEGLRKRGMKSFQYTGETNELTVIRAVSETDKGNYGLINLHGKKRWVDLTKVTPVQYTVNLVDELSINIQDYIEEPVAKSVIMLTHNESELLNIWPDDLRFELANDEQTDALYYDAYSLSYDEHVRLNLDDLIRLNTRNIGLQYGLKKNTTLSVKTVLNQMATQEISDVHEVTELARTTIGADQSVWIYGVTNQGEQYWIPEEILSEYLIEELDDEDESSSRIEADVDLVTDLKPLVADQHLDHPWITRAIDVQVDGEHYEQLIRQNGRTYVQNSKNDMRELTDETNYQEQPLIEGNGRNWGRLDKFTFIAIGRLSPEKNQTMLLDAFAQVHQKYPNTELIILGSGVAKNLLEDQVHHLDISESVLFAGQVDNPMDYLCASDVFVHPSLYEGQPMVLLEALMQNRVIVATNIAANVGVLGNQKYGMVSSDVTADAFSETMLFAIESQCELMPFDVKDYQAHAIDKFNDAVNN